MDTQTLIIGGGLSGLYTAFELYKRQRDFLLIEARDRLGGRILTYHPPQEPRTAEGPGFDLGPTWFWPGQARMERLVDELGLTPRVFEQPSDGDALLEMDAHNVRRGDFGASMAGSYRIEGGIGELRARMATQLPRDRILRSHRAVSIEKTTEGVATTLESGTLESGTLESGKEERRRIHSASAVLALPPRVALDHIRLDPTLSEERAKTLGRLPTWMAGQGKLLAIYDRPFWREQGLSGDAMSYIGPMAEIHDASPMEGGPYALFGFFGVPVPARRNEEALQAACLAQLRRLFGEPAGRPTRVLTKDWAFDPLTTTPADLRGPAVHSLIGLDQPVEPGWDGRLIWSGSETASPDQRNNGYLEGALEAGLRTVELLDR